MFSDGKAYILGVLWEFMKKKTLRYLLAGVILGLFLAFILIVLTNCPFDMGPHGFYCEDFFQISLPLLGFIIPIVVFYFLAKR